MQRVVEKLTPENRNGVLGPGHVVINLSTAAEWQRQQSQESLEQTDIWQGESSSTASTVNVFLGCRLKTMRYAATQASGEPLSIEQLIEYLPALNEVACGS